MNSVPHDQFDGKQSPSEDQTFQSDEFPPSLSSDGGADHETENLRTVVFPDQENDAADDFSDDSGFDSHTVLSDPGDSFAPELPSDPAETSSRTSPSAAPRDASAGARSDPAGGKQVGSLSSSSDVESHQTFLSDDSFPPPALGPDSSLEGLSSLGDGPSGSAMPTISSHDSGFASAPHTISSGDDFDLDEPGRTYQSDEQSMPSDGGDASAQTFVSDGDVDLILSKTWGAGIHSGTNPGMTIKASEVIESVAFKPSAIPVRHLGEPASAATGEYALLKVLGEGGMGIVWDARQRSVERNVAIKMIKSSIAAKAKQTEKFIAEAIVTGDLEHPNIVPIHELGQDQQGNFFYAMKHVQGTPWNKVIRVMELHENLDVLLRTCDAIAFAHARGIIHRDLKPENIMLGDFGEVLVMDWGLALPTEEFSKKDRISRAHGMGGTPAYMAPEMATGPISRVNYTSDVYLLGAILFEIVTGHPPHRGKTTQQCLAAAMRNIIAPVDQDSELLEIARKSMHSDTQQRYQTVKHFQQAVRNYLAHEKSLEISRRAHHEFELARHSGDYTNFSRSLFGYEEAIALWNDNDDANEGLLEARLAYATTALEKGDFDLAESLVDRTDPDHEELIGKIRAAKEDRIARQRMLRIAKTSVAVLAVSILVVVGVSYYLVNQEMMRAVKAEKDANEQRAIAVEQSDRATEQSRIADQQRTIAVASSEEAVREKNRAEEREQEAKTQRAIALVEKERAEQAQRAEQYESYIARIGLAAAKVDENAFSDARQLLLQCPPELRNWEWGRLMYLCSQSSREYLADAPVDGLALSPDGSQFATASWNGQVRVWDRDSDQPLRTMSHAGIYVHCVDWSPDGRVIVSGSADSGENLRFWNAATGELLARVAAHTDAIIGVRFSDDGAWLVTCSYDNTARLWDVRNVTQPQLTATLVGHTWWVWDADFQPGFKPGTDRDRLVTVGQDRKAIVWKISEEGRRVRPEVEFLEHSGAVYCVSYDPSGKFIATGGYDRLIHYWNPDQIEPFDFAAAVSGERLPQQKYRTFSGHIGPVRCVRFSTKGDLLVSGAQDNAVRIWSTQTGSSIKTFRGHDNAVRACALSPDSRFVLSGAEDQRVILWSVNDYAEIQTLAGQELSGHADAILAAYFSPDGQDVVTASRDRSARVWNARTGKQELLLTEGHQYLSSRGVFLKDEQFLVTAAADNTVRIWNTATGTELRHLNGTGRAALLAASDDQRWLATGSDRDSILIWNVGDLLQVGEAEPKPVAELKGHAHPVTALAFVPGSERLVSGDTHGRCILWQTLDLEPIWSVRHHTLKIAGFDFAEAGTKLLSASLDRTIGVTDLASGAELMDEVLSMKSPVTAVATADQGRVVVAVANAPQTEKVENAGGATVQWWRPATGESRQWTLDNLGVNGLTVNRDGTEAFLACTDNTLKTLNLTTGEVALLLDGNRHGGLIWSSVLSRNEAAILTIGGVDARLWERNPLSERMSFGPHGAVAATAISPDGKTIVTGSWDQSLKFWDLATGQTRRKISQAHSGFINSVAYDRAGQRLVTAGDDRVAKIWDIESGQPIVVLTGHTGTVYRAIFSPDGKQVLTASADRTLRLWDAETGEQLGAPFTGHIWGVLSADYSPDGNRIVSCSEDSKAILWDVRTRMPIAELSGHTAAVTGARFSQDGQRVLTSSRDNTAKLWDVSESHEGKEILTLKRHTREVTAVDFSHDSLRVLTAGRDGMAILWPALDWRIPAVAAQPAAAE